MPVDAAVVFERKIWSKCQQTPLEQATSELHPEGWLRVRKVPGGAGVGKSSLGEDEEVGQVCDRVEHWKHLQKTSVISSADKVRRRVERLERRAGARLGKALGAEDLGSFCDITRLNCFCKWHLGLAEPDLCNILPMGKYSKFQTINFPRDFWNTTHLLIRCRMWLHQLG